MALIRHPKDFWAGVFFIAVGTAAIVIALDYAMGTAGRMGPGYFPRWLGGIMVGIGALLVLRSFRLQADKIQFPTFRPLLIVLGSVFLFAVTVNWAGLVLSTILLVLASSVASHEYRWKESIVAAIALAVFVVLAFRWGLQLQLPTWPPALVG
ncbi:MAG: tripartite tricarboxylate transporter TctB family protein [Burkholderiales bacterium]|nr:tripartite tricarboxylate transporter TctB family protein [Burkholderiales bacterium]GIK85068.1 MAG: membrane protein [Betaproteobacteria bacterium]